MRILVLSDSHGDAVSMRMAIQNSSPDVVIFLGDGMRDWELNLPYIKCRKTAAVKGNCDLYHEYPVKTIEELEGKRIYCTHGYMEGVKYGIEALKKCAREENADIVLYGHTHTAYSSYDNGLYILNPGSVRANSCGIVEITPQGILCFTKKIVP